MLEKAHNDRSSNVIRQICNDFNRPATISLGCQLCNIYLQDIILYDFCIGKSRKGLL